MGKVGVAILASFLTAIAMSGIQRDIQRDSSRSFTWMHEPLAWWNDELHKMRAHSGNCALDQQTCEKVRQHLAMMESHGAQSSKMFGELLSYRGCVLAASDKIESRLNCRL